MTKQKKGLGAHPQPREVSPLSARTIAVQGQPESVRLEPSYWEALEDICQREGTSVDDLCSDLAQRLDGTSPRPGAAPVSLANAIRVFIVGYYRQAATEYGHRHAGHGVGDPFRSTHDEGTAPVRH